MSTTTRQMKPLVCGLLKDTQNLNHSWKVCPLMETKWTSKAMEKAETPFRDRLSGSVWASCWSFGACLCQIVSEFQLCFISPTLQSSMWYTDQFVSDPPPPLQRLGIYSECTNRALSTELFSPSFFTATPRGSILCASLPLEQKELKCQRVSSEGSTLDTACLWNFTCLTRDQTVLCLPHSV